MARCNHWLRRAFACLHAKRQATNQHTKRRQLSPAPRAKHQPSRNTLKGDSPPPPQFARHGAHTKPPQTFHHPNTEPPRNTLNRDSPPPPQFARHGAHTLNHHATQRTGEIPRTPEPQMRRGIDIPRRDIRVSEAKRGRVPCRSKGKYLYLKPSKIFFRGNAKIPPIPKNQRDFL